MAQRINVPAENIKDAFLISHGLEHLQYLLYPANFWKHKNHEMLLVAFSHARTKGLPEQIKLVCTGAPGELHEWLLKAILAMGLQEHVILPGYLSNEELSVILHNSRGMIFPSLYEGFGLPVVEAMAAGIPVACSNVTSLPEVAAGAAILFDPRIPEQISTAIISLVTDEGVRSRCVEAGYRRSAEFDDSEKMAREYLDIFEYACKNMVRSDMLSGVFADGWAGEDIHVTISPDTKCTAVEVEFFAPEWLPSRMIQIRCLMPDGRTTSQTICRGHTEVITCPAHADGELHVAITPGFVPSDYSDSSDSRLLSLMLQRCTMLLENDTQKQLYPEDKH